MKKQTRTKFSDPLIVPRVKNYLAENVDKTFVDVSQMARSLKERYREYSGRSENAFCQMVEAAYKVVLQSYGLDGASSSGSEDSDDLELLDDSNVLNDQLMAMYKMQEKKGNHKKDRGSDKTSELIDISSDEDSGTGKTCKLPKLNDQITISPHVPDATPQKPKQVVPVVSINASKESAPVSARAPTPVLHEGRKRRPGADPTTKPGPLKRKSAQGARGVPVTESDILEPNKTTVTFDDIGGMSGLLERVCDLMMHMRHPEVFRRLGVAGARGALLHGPPGCGKTLLAHAIAGRLGLPLLALPATELVGPLSGESERRIREAFDKARALAPCVLFIDEIDAICADRQNAQKDMERRMVSQLLASLDALGGAGEGQGSESVLVLAACANPAALDPALRRAGRFEHELALGIPNRAARRDILRVLSRPLVLHPAVDLDSVARLTPGFVGADLRALLDRACTLAIKRVFLQLKVQPTPDPPLPTPAPTFTGDAPNGESTPRVDINTGSQNGELPEVTVNDKEDKTETIGSPTVLPVVEEVIPLDPPTDAEADSVKQVEESRSNVDNVLQVTQVEPQIAICETYKKEDSSQLELEDMQKYLDEAEPFTEEQLSKINVMMDDILNALKTTKPCAIREGFATVPDTRWEDVGSLADVRRELQLAVLAPVKYPEQLAALGLAAPGGVLLCGPPGCGKTLLAKAVANEAGINFISVKGPELLNMYVGESERAVRTCFQRARNSAPCVIFFDEFDSLCPRRSTGDTGGASRLVNQLLTEMDGVEGREGVFVLAATNRPDIVDPAVLRPGRLDRVLFVGMPGPRDREEILEAITRHGQRPQLGADVSLQELAASTEGFTGADLAGLVRLAATEALTDFITGNISSSPLLVSSAQFRKALLKMKPSVSAKEQQHYEKLRQKYSSVGEEKADVEMDTEEWMDTV